jgi:hypothetical protein
MDEYGGTRNVVRRHPEQGSQIQVEFLIRLDVSGLFQPPAGGPKAPVLRFRSKAVESSLK